MGVIRTDQVARILLAALATLAVVMVLPLESFAQDRPGMAGSFLVSPFGAIAPPTGRFSEVDSKAEPPKSGHKTGYAFGGEVGYFLTDGLAVGIGVRMASFDIDFGSEIEAQFPAKTAKTDVIMAEAWGRWFLPGGFDHWKPYVVGGFGLGRPKGTVEYDNPFIITLPDNSGTIEVQGLTSTINTSYLVTGGIGVLVPLGSNISVNFEPRYTSIDTKGTDRTDEYKTSDGEVTEVKDTAKNNTNWWEIRCGVVFSL